MTAPTNRTVLFVYGTLMRTGKYHSLMAEARWMGEARTRAGYALWDLGEYPAMTPGPGRVQGELYEVPAATLARLDEFEDHPTLFRRRRIVLDGGISAEAYLLGDAATQRGTLIPSGDWHQRGGGPDPDE